MRPFISALILASGCSGAIGSADGTLANGLGPVHFIGDDAPTGSTAPIHLVDDGGPKLHDLTLVAVAWGQNVLYTDQLDLPKFYESLASGPYLDVLSEYLPDPAAVHRRFAGLFVDGNPPSESYATDLMISQELGRLIDSGQVPPNQGDTLYVVHLPPGMKAVDPLGGFSCVDFCGYHYSQQRPEGALRYAVIADMTTPGCKAGCGAYLDDGSVSRPGLESATISASHEVAEAVTDPNVGLYIAGDATQLGWYDDNHGEVGDICRLHADGIDGFVVQKEWSNAKSECRSHPAELFELAPVDPVHVTSNGTTTVTLHTTRSVPTPATVALSYQLQAAGTQTLAQSLPGLTAQLEQTQIQAGDSTTLTLTSGPVDHAEADTLWLVAATPDGSQSLRVQVPLQREPAAPAPSPIPLYTGPAGAPYHCPSGSTFSTNSTDEMYCVFENLPLGGNPYCDLTKGYVGYSWSDAGPDLACDPGATRGDDGAGNVTCAYAIGAVPPAAASYCQFVADGYEGYSWELCPPGSRAANSDGIEWCLFEQLSLPTGAQAYCDHLSQGYFGFSYPLAVQPHYQCPAGFTPTSNGADLGFCLIAGLPIPADLTINTYCGYLVSNSMLGFYWQVP